MKPGDFVEVHFREGGSLMGQIVSDDGDTISVEFTTGIGEGVIIQGILKSKERKSVENKTLNNIFPEEAEKRKMIQDNWKAQMNMLGYDESGNPLP